MIHNKHLETQVYFKKDVEEPSTNGWFSLSFCMTGGPISIDPYRIPAPPSQLPPKRLGVGALDGVDVDIAM